MTSAMLFALREFVPDDGGDHSELGIRDWDDEVKIAVVDDWIELNSERANEWLRSHAVTYRSIVVEATGE